MLSDNNHWGVAQVQYGMGIAGPGPGRCGHGACGTSRTPRRSSARWTPGSRSPAAWPGSAGSRWPAATSTWPGTRLAESLRISQACGQRLGIARGLEAFAALAAARQQSEQAARLAGAATQLRESLGQPTSLGSRVEEMLELARGRLGAAAAAALFAEGREMTADDAGRLCPRTAHRDGRRVLPAGRRAPPGPRTRAGRARRRGPIRPPAGRPHRSPRASTRSWSSSSGACPTGRSPTSW